MCIDFSLDARDVLLSRPVRQLLRFRPLFSFLFFAGKCDSSQDHLHPHARAPQGHSNRRVRSPRTTMHRDTRGTWRRCCSHVRPLGILTSYCLARLRVYFPCLVPCSDSRSCLVRLHMPEGMPAPSSNTYASAILNECRDVPLALSYILGE